MGSWKLHLELADCGRMTGNPEVIETASQRTEEMEKGVTQGVAGS